MKVKLAANKMRLFILKSKLPDHHKEYGKDHLLDMVLRILNNEVTGKKAHRWLGWIQGCVCVGKGATLEEMKLVNFKA